MATSVWGSCGPLPTLATMTLPGVIGWRSPTPGTLAVRWGCNFLKRGPPTPDPKVLLLCHRRGSAGSLACSSLRAALKRSSKSFATTFSSPLPHAFITLFHPTSQSRASTSPSKHNVAVPINKVEGRLRGANPVGGGVRAARHPMRGAGKGFGAEGGFTRNEGGGA